MPKPSNCSKVLLLLFLKDEDLVEISIDSFELYELIELFELF